MAQDDDAIFARLAARLATLADRGQAGSSGEALAGMLDTLLEACGCLEIAPLSHEPDLPTPREALARLAAGFASLGEQGDGRFCGPCWPDLKPEGGQRRGDRRLDEGAWPQTLAHVLLLAGSVDPPLIYRMRRAPVRVQALTVADAPAGGPFLALMTCRSSMAGDTHLAQACARPVYSGRRLIPVRSGLDRDVLALVEHLQVALDAHGIDLAAQLNPDASLAARSRLALTLRWPNGAVKTLTVLVDGQGTSGTGGDLHGPERSDREACFALTPETWADGRFSRWLEANIEQ